MRDVLGRQLYGNRVDGAMLAQVLRAVPRQAASNQIPAPATVANDDTRPRRQFRSIAKGLVDFRCGRRPGLMPWRTALRGGNPRGDKNGNDNQGNQSAEESHASPCTANRRPTGNRHIQTGIRPAALEGCWESGIVPIGGGCRRTAVFGLFRWKDCTGASVGDGVGSPTAAAGKPTRSGVQTRHRCRFAARCCAPCQSSRGGSDRQSVSSPARPCRLLPRHGMDRLDWRGGLELLA